MFGLLRKKRNNNKRYFCVAWFSSSLCPFPKGFLPPQEFHFYLVFCALFGGKNVCLFFFPWLEGVAMCLMCNVENLLLFFSLVQPI